MQLSIVVKEKREIPAAEVAEIAKYLKEQWEKTDEDSVFAYDVLDEAANRGLIELPPGWSHDSDEEEESVTDSEIAEAIEDESDET